MFWSTRRTYLIRPIFFFLHHLILTTANSSLTPYYYPVDDIAVNCGSFNNSIALDGREWTGDTGSQSTFRGIEMENHPGQKFIRLHFYPALYPGFERSKAFFTVKAGAYTLLSNFSASLTADELGLKSFAKEFCVNIEENQALSITFSPSPSSTSDSIYAFVNGIEITSMPSGLYYTPDGDPGAHVVGQKHRFHIDNSTALELVQRLNIGGSSISSVEDSGMFRQWSQDFNHLLESGVSPVTTSIPIKYTNIPTYAAPQKVYQTAWSMDPNRQANKMCNLTWKLPVDVGFRDYVVMVDGNRVEGKRDLLIALQPHYYESRSRHNIGAVLNGLEVFKLSNPDNSLAGQNPEPVAQSARSTTPMLQKLLSPFRNGNAISAYSSTDTEGEQREEEMINLSMVVNMSINRLTEEEKKEQEEKVVAISGPDKKHVDEIIQLISTRQPTGSPISVQENIADMPKEKTNKKTITKVVQSIAKGMDLRRRKTKPKDSSSGSSRWWSRARSTTEAKPSVSPESSHYEKPLPALPDSPRNEPPLPVLRCRHFNLTEIRAATNNFHRDLVIQYGGPGGEIFRGYIDDGKLQVAIEGDDINFGKPDDPPEKFHKAAICAYKKFRPLSDVTGVCHRCKDQIEWKHKYGKYKPLTEPAKCQRCSKRAVRQAYHNLCTACAKEQHVCAKCSSRVDRIIGRDISEVEAEQKMLDEAIKNARERDRRTLLRAMNKGKSLSSTSEKSLMDNGSKAGELLAAESVEEDAESSRDDEDDNDSEEDEVKVLN
ncbi:Receptor-like protein kinase FERONIA [Camellia lanceoleosa]|uniref:Receptor-like protein kinase FERONIA n=1 Tax=Camellia lanceoleosa TaxID=1840588 RepID=A0ACC0HTB7_9ERIC|nr:Receptor-like protein kinase FERONIA [Camellia lanceoleosa]